MSQSNWKYSNYKTFECWDYTGVSNLYGFKISGTISREYMSKDYALHAECYDDENRISSYLGLAIATLKRNYPDDILAKNGMESFVSFIRETCYPGRNNE